MKWSLKAGMSFSVAMQPSADMKQLITNGRTGTGDMFSGILVDLRLTDQITLLANLSLPLQAIDERALAAFAAIKNMSYRYFRTNNMSAIPLSNRDKSKSHYCDP